MKPLLCWSTSTPKKSLHNLQFLQNLERQQIFIYLGTLNRAFTSLCPPRELDLLLAGAEPQIIHVKHESWERKLNKSEQGWICAKKQWMIYKYIFNVLLFQLDTW
jgi:hypothetical protein